MERREAPAFSKRERGKTEDWCATRCSIPSLLRGGDKGTTAYPGPRTRALTHVCGRLAPAKSRLYKPPHHSRGCLAFGPDNWSKRPSGGPFTGLTHFRGGSTGEDYGAS